jgi:hypothetical protein
LLRDTVGLRSYWPYLVPLFVAHLLLVHLIWRLAIYCGSSRLIATGVVAPLTVLGAGAENLLWAFQITFVAPLMLGVAAMILVNRQQRWGRREWFAILLLLMSLLFSALSVVMVIGVMAVCLARSGVRRALAIGVLPLVTYAAWWSVYHVSSPYGASGFDDYAANIWPYIARGLSAAADAFFLNVPGLGAVCLVVLAVYVVRTSDRVRTAAAPAYVLGLTAVVTLASAGYTRLKFGPDEAAASRYRYVVIVMVAPLASVALTRCCARSSSLILGVVAVLCAVTLSNVMQLRHTAAEEAGREATVRNAILGAASLAMTHADAIPATAQPEPLFSPDVTIEDIRRWVRDNAFPAVQATRHDVLTAALNMLVAVRASSAARQRTGCNLTPPGVVESLQVGRRRVRLPFWSLSPAALDLQLAQSSNQTHSATRLLSWNGGSGQLTVYPQTTATLMITPQGGPVWFCTRDVRDEG